MSRAEPGSELIPERTGAESTEGLGLFA
jgi:hypothetical protein